MYLYKNKFYEQIKDIFDLEEINNFEDGWECEIQMCSQQTIETIDGDYIADRIDDDRFSEDNDIDEKEQIAKILNDYIDWKSINAMLPKLWYANGKIQKMTKQKLLELWQQ